ncbi:hypothetical protein [Streptomyces sp. NRRL S-646]|uniref:hypothetical protein n=1 Tax=Streptomyces sp. NRRL S-646 TaxID=1463917 RepID=UPI001331432A|nr:hypothetical protein [Streptomyces sp. NRRL S-646]
MKCPFDGSVNIEKVSHRWRSLSGDAEAKDELAPPDVVEARYFAVLAVIAAGFWVLVSGSVLLGLLVAAGGLVWGVIMSREVAETVAARNRWAHEVICLTCLHRWVP